MINLLPPETKHAYRYAMQNERLMRWVVALLVALIGLGAIGTYGWVSLHQAITTNSNSVNQIQKTLAAENLTGTENQVQTISNDFSLVVKVLSQEVLFSKLLKQIAAAMPQGANLTSLNITSTTKGSGLDITAESTNYTAATQVQVNLADPSNGIFSKADIVNISCSSSSAANNQNSQYPCTVTLRAQFAANNQFLFINQKAN